jgi:hypothetical protein
MAARKKIVAVVRNASFQRDPAVFENGHCGIYNGGGLVASSHAFHCKETFPMEIYPLDWPRLSGTLYYGPPYPWKLQVTEEAIRIVPAKVSYGLILYFVVLALVVTFGIPLILTRLLKSPQYWVVTLFCAAAGLALTLCGVGVYLLFAGMRARGPVLAISLLKREVALPREHKTWALDRIVRWEIVSGWWVRGYSGKPSIIPDVISELQMIVTDDKGKESAWPIIGGPGPHNTQIDEVATTIASKTGLPMTLLEVKGPLLPIPPRTK